MRFAVVFVFAVLPKSPADMRQKAPDLEQSALPLHGNPENAGDSSSQA